MECEVTVTVQTDMTVSLLSSTPPRSSDSPRPPQVIDQGFYFQLYSISSSILRPAGTENRDVVGNGKPLLAENVARGIPHASFTRLAPIATETLRAPFKGRRGPAPTAG